MVKASNKLEENKQSELLKTSNYPIKCMKIQAINRARIIENIRHILKHVVA